MATLTRSMTYAELVTAINISSLHKGESITITDFATRHFIVDGLSDTQILDEGVTAEVTGIIEPLMVFATSANTIDIVAKSTLFPNDKIEYDWNPANWMNNIYFITGETPTLITGFKGVITRREDYYGNCINFDKEIKYRLYSIAQPAWSVETEYSATAFVQSGTKIYYCLGTNTGIEPGVTDGWVIYWKFAVDIDIDPYLAFSADGIEIAGIENSIPIMSLSDYTEYNIYPYDASNNIFDKSNVVPVTIFKGTQIYGNKFGPLCRINIFGSECFDNNLSSACDNNIFIKSCQANFLENECGDNLFSVDCYDNHLGINCSFNTFHKSFQQNIMGVNCSENIFGENCINNSFGSNFQRNILGSGFNSNSIGNNVTNLNLPLANVTNLHIVDNIDFTGIDLSGITQLVGNYSKTILKDNGENIILVYFDSVTGQSMVNLSNP